MKNSKKMFIKIINYFQMIQISRNAQFLIYFIMLFLHNAILEQIEDLQLGCYPLHREIIAYILTALMQNDYIDYLCERMKTLMLTIE